MTLPRIALFPMALAGLVVAGALAVNLVGSSYDVKSERIAEASQLVTKAREAYVQEDWPQVRGYAGQAVALEPTHITARLILGLAYMNMNALDQAEAEFRQVLTLAKNDLNSAAWAHNNLGVVFQRRGQPGLAAHEYQTALDLDPSNGQARANLVEVRRYLQQ
ncbi:MAG: tetratricopeptide repeat protein [Dehalococcoidia bacterium]|nr:tetratricopeptide repeat protein [Dehalococcoidia bacterium]